MTENAMRLLSFRHLWGLLGEGGVATLQEAAAIVRSSQVPYVGIEHALLAVSDRRELSALLEEYRLDLIPMVMTFGSSIADHLSSYRMQLEWCAELPHRQITAHSGRDAFDDAQAYSFFDEALRMEQDLGLTVAHETHRSRVLFHPWITQRCLERFPSLKLCADLSHWVVVCERIPSDAEDAIALAIDRTIHIHARVGHEQGPQVWDPHAPEWETQVAAHERWWDGIWHAQWTRGMKESTLTAEYGPPNYLPTPPRTREPTVDLRVLCDAEALRQRERFERFSMQRQSPRGVAGTR